MDILSYVLRFLRRIIDSPDGVSSRLTTIRPMIHYTHIRVNILLRHAILVMSSYVWANCRWANLSSGETTWHRPAFTLRNIWYLAELSLFHPQNADSTRLWPALFWCVHCIDWSIVVYLSHCKLSKEKSLLPVRIMLKPVITDRRLVSSVGRAPVCWAGGRGFKPRPDQHSGS